MEYLVTALAGFACVFVAGFQSRAVNHGNYVWAVAGSFGLSMSQAFLWKHVNTPLDALIYAVSGAMGITSAMYVHNRWIQKKEPTP